MLKNYPSQTMHQNSMYSKSCANKLFFKKLLRKELYVKVVCTVKVMMRFYVSEHVCYKLYTKLYLQVITFQRKKIMELKSFPKRKAKIIRLQRVLGKLLQYIKGRPLWGKY